MKIQDMNAQTITFVAVTVQSLCEKIAELEKANEELNRQLQIVTSKYIDADMECNALRRECARRG